MTDDIQWRYNLKKDDLIDCQDDYRSWYWSTILDTRIDKNQCEQVLVGYRIYEAEGRKVDEDNNNYTGWGVKFDEWLSRTDPKI